MINLVSDTNSILVEDTDTEGSLVRQKVLLHYNLEDDKIEIIVPEVWERVEGAEFEKSIVKEINEY